jgi:hypothetical protein
MEDGGWRVSDVGRLESHTYCCKTISSNKELTASCSPEVRQAFMKAW